MDFYKTIFSYVIPVCITVPLSRQFWNSSTKNVLATEIYKVKNGIAPEIMTDIFKRENPLYNLRSYSNQFKRKNINTVNYGLHIVKYPGPEISELVPNNSKYNNYLSKFKKSIKAWKPEASPSRLCKTHIAQVGFI